MPPLWAPARALIEQMLTIRSEKSACISESDASDTSVHLSCSRLARRSHTAGISVHTTSSLRSCLRLSTGPIRSTSTLLSLSARMYCTVFLRSPELPQTPPTARTLPKRAERISRMTECFWRRSRATCLSLRLCATRSASLGSAADVDAKDSKSSPWGPELVVGDDSEAGTPWPWPPVPSSGPLLPRSISRFSTPPSSTLFSSASTAGVLLLAAAFSCRMSKKESPMAVPMDFVIPGATAGAWLSSPASPRRSAASASAPKASSAPAASCSRALARLSIRR
mmetsp:Transcript_17259/g.35255  ORF Transcript_17259/g.35255 Transcript_17259/m.35255 type:complete len:281 (-) Transcript_17259:1294-2136(-)